jgi:hypothetical protein
MCGWETGWITENQEKRKLPVSLCKGLERQLEQNGKEERKQTQDRFYSYGNNYIQGDCIFPSH